jgi:excisionase family DNA binding protein
MTSWVPISQAAEQLGVSVDTVKRRIREGKLPTQKDETHFRFRWLVGI